MWRSLRRLLLGLTVLFVGAFGAAVAYPTSAPAARASAILMGGEYLGQEGVRLQKGEVDCGVAALEMVFESHGLDTGALESIRTRVVERDAGLTFEEMRQIASAHGLAADGWRMEVSELAGARLPALVHLPGHFVVVDRVTPAGQVELRDPAVGRVRMPVNRFARKWTGNVLLFSRS